MPRIPTFKVKNTSKGWLLNVPATISDTGAQQRRYYPTRALALEEASRLRADFVENGQRASVLPPRVAGDAAAAWAILEKKGVTLLEAARFYAAYIDARDASVSIEEMLDAFSLAKGDLSDSQVNHYRQLGQALRAYFPGRILSSINHGEILDFLDQRTSAPAAYNLNIRLLNAIWRWSAKQPRNWCDERVTKGIDRRPTESGDVGILTPFEAKTLLRAAEKFHPDCVAPIAIALFAGLRQQELVRLEPHDITEEGITVPALASKTKRRRYIHMTEPLASWLKAYPTNEAVCPPNWGRKQRALRRHAGWRVWSEEFEPPEPSSELPLWPHNALRHTAATVALAAEKPLEVLIFEHGHSGGVNTLRRHYIGRMTKKDAAEIQGLMPVSG